MFDSLLTVDPAATMKITEFLAFVAVVSICAGVLYLVYRHITPNEPGELEFASTVFILTIAIGLLVSIIKHAPAISFGLFGAMSIVRFRSQIKRPQRMIFIFMAAAIGVCCGAGEYLTTVMGTLVLSALTLAAFRMSPAHVDVKTIRLKAANTPLLDGVKGLSSVAAGERNWGVEFLPATLADGSRFRILVVVDEDTREALAVVPETSFSSARVLGELDRLMTDHGKPKTIASDSWPQFASRAAQDWKKVLAIDWIFIDQQPQTEPYVVGCAHRLRDEAHAAGGYVDLIEARRVLEDWRLAHNETVADQPERGLRLAASTATVTNGASPAVAARLIPGDRAGKDATVTAPDTFVVRAKSTSSGS